MALALYRKYRPATFAEVVGQDHVTEPLRTALAAGRINHAYLFSGPRGCGKTSSARIMARSLNCVEGPTPDPCGVCPSCIALAPEGPGSLDVVELDAASHGGVDDTRELRDRAFYMPAESRYRVFIIDEAHMVSAAGFNALLKIVEEPPEHLVFIFATTEPEKVMTTIRSRTHHYPFRLIPPATLRKLLEKLCAEENVAVEAAVYPLVIRAGGGSARDSLSILDQLLAGAGPEGVTYRHAVALLGVTDSALLDETVDAFAANDGASVFGAIDKVVEAGHDPRRFAADLLQRFRDLVILAAVPEAGAKGLIDAPEDQLAAMQGQSERLGAGTLTRLADVLHTGLTEMRGTTAPRLALELMCARMLLPAASGGDGALVQRVERLEQVMASGSVALPVGSAAAVSPPAAAAPARPAAISAPAPARVAEPATVEAAAVAAPPVSPPAAATGYRRPSLRTEAERPAAPASPPAAAIAPAAVNPALGLPPPPVLSSSRRSTTAGRTAAAPAPTPATAPPSPPSPSDDMPTTDDGSAGIELAATPAATGSPAAGSADTDSAPSDSAPTDSAPTDSTPTDSAPTESAAAATAVTPAEAIAATPVDDWLPPDAPPDEDEYGDPPTTQSGGRPDRHTPSGRPAVAAVPSDTVPQRSRSTATRPASVPVPAVRVPSTRAAGPQAGESTPAPQHQPARPEPAAAVLVPSPTQQPQAAESAASGGIGVTDARRVWPEILTAVQRRKRVTQAMLQSATVVDLKANVLHLSLAAPSMARRVMEPANVSVLREALKEVLGVDWAVRCDVPGDSAPSAKPNLSLVPNPTSPADDGPDDEDVSTSDPVTSAYAPGDPEVNAIELLTQQLGAKRLDS